MSSSRIVSPPEDCAELGMAARIFGSIGGTSKVAVTVKSEASKPTGAVRGVKLSLNVPAISAGGKRTRIARSWVLALIICTRALESSLPLQKVSGSA